MAKKPENSERIMFGEKKPAAEKLSRAEIITRGPDGKMRVEQGGEVQDSVPRPAKRRPQPATPATSPPTADPPPEPSPPSTASPPPASSSPKAHSKAIAETMVTGFVDRLRIEAERRGGALSVADIQGMQTEFQTQAAALQSALEHSFDAYARARERANWDKARHRPFDRALVKRFSHLFKGRQGRDSVSRRMLPGFFLAVSMMLGPDAIEAYQGRARVIVDRLRGGRDEFDWDEVYAAPDIRRLVIDAQVAMLPYFTEFDRRSAWFVTLVNSNLAPPADGASEAEAAWEMTDAAFRRFLGAFLKDLRDAVTSPDGRAAFAKRHGQQAVDDAIHVLKQLDGFG